MNIQEYAKMRGQIDKMTGQLEAAFALIHAITTQLDRQEERLCEMENKRGPGRPPKQVESHASD
jgi:hypothetical protein